MQMELFVLYIALLFLSIILGLEYMQLRSRNSWLCTNASSMVEAIVLIALIVNLIGVAAIALALLRK